MAFYIRERKKSEEEELWRHFAPLLNDDIFGHDFLALLLTGCHSESRIEFSLLCQHNFWDTLHFLFHRKWEMIGEHGKNNGEMFPKVSQGNFANMRALVGFFGSHFIKHIPLVEMALNSSLFFVKDKTFWPYEFKRPESVMYFIYNRIYYHGTIKLIKSFGVREQLNASKPVVWYKKNKNGCYMMKKNVFLANLKLTAKSTHFASCQTKVDQKIKYKGLESCVFFFCGPWAIVQFSSSFVRQSKKVSRRNSSETLHCGYWGTSDKKKGH